MDRPPLPKTLPGARFDCHGSGACCRGWHFGPVAEGTIRELERLDAGALVPGLPEGQPFYRVVPGDGGPQFFLETRGGACVFLTDDSSCRVHTAHGAQAKPWFCRAFPFALIAGPDGLRIGWRPECAGRHRLADNQTPLSEYAESVRADADHYPFRAVFPDGTALPGGVAIPPAAYPRVEARLIEEIERPHDDFDAVFPALRAYLGAVAQAVDHVLPERSVADHARALQEIADVCREDPARLVLAGPDETPTGWSASRLAEMVAAGPRTAALTAGAARFLREELANHVYTGAVTVHGGLAAGFGGFLLASLVARGYAATRSTEPVSAEALNTAWVLWHRVTGWRDPKQAWQPVRPALETLFLGAPATGG